MATDVFLWLVAPLLVAVGSLLYIIRQRPRPGIVLRWTFASIVGLLAGSICWFYAQAALSQESLKTMEESDRLSRRGSGLFGGKVSIEDMQRAKKLLEEAKAGITQAENTALLAFVLATATTTFLCGVTLQWLMRIPP